MIYNYGVPLYIIDGYNVVFNPKFKNGRGKIERARSALVSYVENYASSRKVEFEIFWDGGGEATGDRRDGYRVKEFFTRSGQNADEKIIRRVEQLKNKRRAIVVTNDRRHIAGIVSNLGARVMTVEKFLELILPPSNEQIDRSDDEFSEKEKLLANDLSVEEWIDFFKRSKNKG